MNLESTVYDDNKLDELCKEANDQVIIAMNYSDKICNNREEYLEYYLARQIEGYITLKQSIIFNAKR